MIDVSTKKGGGEMPGMQGMCLPHPLPFPGKSHFQYGGYGLFVTNVCQDAGVPYYHGEKTITYTACILF